MDRFDKQYYILKNKTKCLYHSFKLFFDQTQKRILNENSKLRDHFHGRCFIIGNGPSLNGMNLSLLKEESVFTVNYAMKNPMYYSINNQFHVMMDPSIFSFDEGERTNRLLQFKQINKVDNKPICFFPYQAIDVIEKYELENDLDIRYIRCDYGMYENYNRAFDLTKVCPGFANVTQFATMIAIYLGFSEIIYIGCDMTGYEQLSITAGKNVQLHAYEMDEKEKEAILRSHSEMSSELFFYGFSNTFADYRKLREYSEKHNIRLLNATPGGVLNEISRVKFEDLFVNA